MSHGKYEEFEFFETRIKIKKMYEAWEIKKKLTKASKKSIGEGFNQHEISW